MFKKIYLENGIPVVMESFKNVRSVAVGVWLKVGSRYEPYHKSGISHLLEHMFFKGTKRLTTKDIAVKIDSMGGDLNAFTARENTALYIKIIDEYLVKCMELLADLFVNSTFPQDELEKEKKIVKEEIKMVEDTPDDYIYDLFNQTVWGKYGLGQSILGRRETVAAFSREDILSHVKKYYGTKDIIISCAGNFNPEHMTSLLNRLFGRLRRGSEPKRGVPPKFLPNVKIFSKNLSEAHICLGVPSLPQASEERYVLLVLNTILGGGVSSRLFQEIRENRGMAYSIYSFTASYYDTGMWAVYAGVSKKKIREAAELIISEMLTLKSTLTDTELERAKQHLKGNLILGLESTSSRMNNIAKQELYFGKYFPPEKIIKSIDMVSLNQVRDLAERLIKKELFAITAHGDLGSRSLDGVL